GSRLGRRDRPAGRRHGPLTGPPGRSQAALRSAEDQSHLAVTAACGNAGYLGHTKEDPMKAKVGDQLVIDGTNLGEPRPGGVVTKVTHPDGSPPYVVRWLNDNHESVVFPGPTARGEATESAATP